MNVTEQPPERRRPGRKPGQRIRTQAEIYRDRKRIMELKILHRKTNPEIVLEINKFYEDEPEESLHYSGTKTVTRPQLSLKQIEKEIQKANEAADEAMQDDVIAERRKLIKQYEAFAAYCFEMHERTLADRKVSTSEEKEINTDKASGTTSLMRELTENRDGNTKYLDLYERAMWRIAELKALIPPKKIAPTNPAGTEQFTGFSPDEETKRLAAIAVEMGLTLINTD